MQESDVLAIVLLVCLGVGLLAAIAIKYSFISFEGITYISPAIAFIIGYAGGDFLDGIYKILLKKVN